MSNKQFISNLSATYADIRKLDVKKINLKGKNILEYIEENGTIILDERGTLANDELDVWNSYITKDENGNVIINRNAKPKEHSVIETNDDANTWMVYEGITESQVNTLKTAVKVIDNEVLDANDEHIMYWQTDGLTNGHRIFITTNLESFSSGLSSLTSGYRMFEGCTNLTTFNADLPSLTSGEWMFDGCKNLTSFNSDLPSLIYGNLMFKGCTNLESFNSDLSSLEFCYDMFDGCTNLTTFNGDLSSLTSSGSMFNNTNLKSFSSDLSSLTNGSGMFSYCSSLTSFDSYLSSLTNGSNMFNGCKLDTKSVATIVTFLPSLPTNESTHVITIGIGIVDNEDAKKAFAEECYCDSWEELNQDFSDKNWIVEWQFNGEASTFDLRSPRPSTAVFARLEEVIMPTEENKLKPHYAYTSQDGTKFYNISWYHESNIENAEYTQFNSLEDAMASWNVFPKENIITTEEEA